MLWDLDTPRLYRLEARLFREDEIPWQEIAFRTVRETLELYASFYPRPVDVDALMARLLTSIALLIALAGAAAAQTPPKPPAKPAATNAAASTQPAGTNGLFATMLPENSLRSPVRPAI